MKMHVRNKNTNKKSNECLLINGQQAVANNQATSVYNGSNVVLG